MTEMYRTNIKKANEDISRIAEEVGPFAATLALFKKFGHACKSYSHYQETIEDEVRYYGPFLRR